MSEAAKDSRYPDRISIGDGPMIQRRFVGIDITPPDLTALHADIQRLRPGIAPDGTFRLGHAEVSFTQQLTREQASALVAGLTAAFQPLSEGLQRTFEALCIALRPLAEFFGEPEPDWQGCHHWCGRWPGHECAGEATGTLAYRPGGRQVPMCDACQQVTRTQPPRPLTLASERNWIEQGSTCAHVCGPTPGHRCDAKAVTSLRHPLPSGGVRHLPLCGPCDAAERTG